MPAVAAAIGGSALVGGITSLIGSSQAASAAKQAANLAQQRYTTTRGDLLPYTTAGYGALPTMNALALSPTGGGPDYVSQAAGMVPPQMTEAELQQTPGYQFTLSQGLRAVNSTLAARGIGVSGSSIKGAASYATGLADSTYKDQFNIAQQRYSDVLGLNTAQQGNIQNQFSRASSLASLGENAGAQTGSIGANLANTSSNALQAAGIASAAGTTGVGNAATGAAQNYLNYNNYQQMLQTVGNSQAMAANNQAANAYLDTPQV